MAASEQIVYPNRAVIYKISLTNRAVIFVRIV